MEELLKHDLEEATFYYSKSDLVLRLPVLDISKSDDGISLELGDNSHLIIWHDSEVKKVKRPSNFIGEFEYCYLIKNSEKENIGYIGKI